MKSSLIFGLISTAAAAAIPTPADGCDSDPVPAVEQTKPVGENNAKLPWLKPGQFSANCGSSMYTDEACGTEMYCKAFDDIKNVTDRKFTSSKQCFAAHDPEPLPWREPGQFASLCGSSKFTDEDCGTDMYCKAFDDIKNVTDRKFTSSKQCFAAHEPNPNPKLPWKEPGQFASLCGSSKFTDDDCGTDMYCKAFDDIKNVTDRKFTSSKQCFDAHEAKPKA
ncbi:hypothetical protein MGU_07954 [Metarhizium guizhouense ARSEF 977]|uniref:Uncharacterized protein n=1 Tax=Metarhizium guizhouense (strain ARSEF 977) TaxID=1276136 RepID=A0A0B4HYJ3_METGA|nr:hypothetical protein MGU_07954 [Metarhizium guizhouense ARSEF 977]